MTTPESTGLDAAITSAVRSAIAAATPAPALEDTDRLASSINEAVRRTGLSRSTLYRLMDSGELGFVKIGSRRLIPEPALVALLQGHQAAA